MSTAATVAGSPAPEQAPRLKKRRFSISLRFKFGFFTFLLITFVMGAVGVTLYVQQRRTLTHEVLERGKTIAEGVAASAKEAILQGDTLTLSVLASRSMQTETDMDLEKSYDLSDWLDVLGGLQDAFENMKDEVPGQLERGLDSLLGQNLNLGFADAMPKPKRKPQNEGVYECYIVSRDGMIAATNQQNEIHKEDTAYTPPHYVQEANESTPFPVYEQEWFDAGKHRHVRRLFDVDEVISDNSEGHSVVMGSVHVGLSEALVDKVIFQATMRLAIIGIGAILLGIFCTYFIVSWLVGPIGKLLKGVLAIASGDFNTRVKVTSKDELGELTRSFNDMAKSLGENELLRGAFTRYVSDAALQQLLNDPSKTGLHSRRALATVYTSDVRGFTAMSESLEPEHVVQVINTYLSLQTEVIQRYEGVVDKFIGDATVGVFGKEHERDDDAIRAVKTAVEVQRKIEEINLERERRGEICKLIGIGINTGIVVSGNMGSTKKMEYTTAGENVILADKLCAECPGGKVWISESTYEMVRDEVEVVEKEPLKLKGRAEAFPVFEVVSLK